jgi:hypothetical protein
MGVVIGKYKTPRGPTYEGKILRALQSPYAVRLFCTTLLFTKLAKCNVSTRSLTETGRPVLGAITIPHLLLQGPPTALAYIRVLYHTVKYCTRMGVMYLEVVGVLYICIRHPSSGHCLCNRRCHRCRPLPVTAACNGFL